MPPSRSKDLFQSSSPEEMLEYLQSRLDARDLSPEEALAVLGVVHLALGQRQVTNKGVYQTYSAFLEALRARMPDIHEFVLAAWAQRGQTETRQSELFREDGSPDAENENAEPEAPTLAAEFIMRGNIPGAEADEPEDTEMKEAIEEEEPQADPAGEFRQGQKIESEREEPEESEESGDGEEPERGEVKDESGSEEPEEEQTEAGEETSIEAETPEANPEEYEEKAGDELAEGETLDEGGNKDTEAEGGEEGNGDEPAEWPEHPDVEGQEP